jgi:hypothetical protein
MTAIATISELLTLSKTQYRIYDLSRKIDKISKEQFTKIELNQLPYPTPSQGHAFIAIAFWQKQTSAPYLWFVKLPLDESGLLNQGARDHFIAIIVEALGSEVTADPSSQQEALLKNNPYHFTPSQYKLASLNSKIKVELKQESSPYLPQCKRYLSGELGWNKWQEVGVQGITDFAARIGEKEHSDLFINALPNLATEVLIPLCSALENEPLSLNLIDCIIQTFKENTLQKNTDQVQQALLRSLSSSCGHPHVSEFIETLLQNNSLTSELLIILSGRCWLVFQDKILLLKYLEQLANHHDLALFNAIFRDLVAIPVIRTIILQCIREPDRSAALAQAIGQLFTSTTVH